MCILFSLPASACVWPCGSVRYSPSVTVPGLWTRSGKSWHYFIKTGSWHIPHPHPFSSPYMFGKYCSKAFLAQAAPHTHPLHNVPPTHTHTHARTPHEPINSLQSHVARNKHGRPCLRNRTGDLYLFVGSVKTNVRFGVWHCTWG
jgi:hypothetical protein